MAIRTIVNRALQAVSGALAIAVSCSALAVPVTQWGFQVNSGFTAFAPVPGVTGSNTNALLGAPSLLTWGTDIGNGLSSLGVGAATNGTVSGSLFTNGGTVNTVQVIHNNQPILAPSLETATLTDVITLQELAPSVGVPFTPAALTFQIHFLETPNSTPCAVPTSPTPCNDIFVIDVAGAGFNPADNTLNQTFFYGGDDYNAILHIAGLGVLGNAACDAVFGNTAHRGCIGFTTVESQRNSFQVALEITDTPFVVPEPGMLALLGLGLAALGFSRRKQG